MAPPSKVRKHSKGGSSPTNVLTFKLPIKFLRSLEPSPLPVKEEVQELKDVKDIKEDSPSKGSDSTLSATIPSVAPIISPEKPAESNTSTPIPSGSALMPPPTEGVKKKGPKRSAPGALGPDGLPKPRGKPGPKKKARLEDGTIDHSNTTPRAPNGTAHKLGPKANQGAINAGLRALDRSGKPCRKWSKATFQVKSFTGVSWELPRWKAPPKVRIDGVSEGSASGESSSKENKDNSQLESEKSEKSHSAAVDVEMVNGLVSSPAPSLPQSSAPMAPPTQDAPTPVASATPVVAASA